MESRGGNGNGFSASWFRLDLCARPVLLEPSEELLMLSRRSRLVVPAVICDGTTEPLGVAHS
jgi:hypothetical protein